MGFLHDHLSPDQLALIRFFLEKACILVTLAFLLTRKRAFTHPIPRKLEFLVPALLFLVIGLAEVLIEAPHGTDDIVAAMNLRIVAAAAAGLIAGPGLGVFTGVAVTVIVITLGQGQAWPIGL